MRRGLQQHQTRNHNVSGLGKDLTRRSGASCELCTASGTRLLILEVPPVLADPDIDRCLHVCEVCHEQLLHPKKRDSDHWHCLTRAVWSNEPVVQVVAVWMARELATTTPWIAELLEPLYLTDEQEQWVQAVAF